MLAFLAVPALHELHHQDDHQHLANGAVVYVDPPHHHAHPHPSPKKDQDEKKKKRAPAPKPLEHGAGLAHFGGASVVGSKPTLLPPPPALAVVEAPRPAREALPAGPHFDAHRARGPPTA